MKQLNYLGDDRMAIDFCVYCGSETETREHIPSRVFLDEPYPSNLPVIPACHSCNEGFSLDEEYVACQLECAISGSEIPDDVQREKIRKILSKKPKLVSKIGKRKDENLFGDISFNVEIDRVQRIILKLALGHAVFELNKIFTYKPHVIFIKPFSTMSEENIEEFETLPDVSLWPEIGSRAFQRACLEFPNRLDWIIVQPGRYRYLVSSENGVDVRIVLSEYLACQIFWKE